MSQLTYTLLKGTVLDWKLMNAQAAHGHPLMRPHLHIKLQAGSQAYDVAVNIASEDQDPSLTLVRYAIKSIAVPHPDTYAALPDGAYNRDKTDAGGIDYVYQQLVTEPETQLLDIFDNSPITPENNSIAQAVQTAKNTPATIAYAFGHRYTPDPNQYSPAWPGIPNDGIHNIHLNQGNAPTDHADENGRYEDGALFLYNPTQNQWTSIFVAFQSQSWNNGPDGYPVESPDY